VSPNRITIKITERGHQVSPNGKAIKMTESEAKKTEFEQISALEREVAAWRECARYDPLMDETLRFVGWDRSGLDRCRREFIESARD
jgi:hypothetical protein